jgi:hypothetical protein
VPCGSAQCYPHIHLVLFATDKRPHLVDFEVRIAGFSGLGGRTVERKGGNSAPFFAATLTPCCAIRQRCVRAYAGYCVLDTPVQCLRVARVYNHLARATLDFVGCTPDICSVVCHSNYDHSVPVSYCHNADTSWENS